MISVPDDLNKIKTSLSIFFPKSNTSVFIVKAQLQPTGTAQCMCFHLTHNRHVNLFVKPLHYWSFSLNTVTRGHTVNSSHLDRQHTQCFLLSLSFHIYI